MKELEQLEWRIRYNTAVIIEEMWDIAFHICYMMILIYSIYQVDEMISVEENITKIEFNEDFFYQLWLYTMYYSFLVILTYVIVDCMWNRKKWEMGFSRLHKKLGDFEKIGLPTKKEIFDELVGKRRK